MGQAECAGTGSAAKGEQHPIDQPSDRAVYADNTGHAGHPVYTVNTKYADCVREEVSQEVCSLPSPQLCK